MSTYDHAIRAANGAAVLDEVQPDWWVTIDPKSIMMSRTCKCILGLTFGSFWKGLQTIYMNTREKKLQLSASWVKCHGFDADHDDDGIGLANDYAGLRAAWVAIIDQRRAEAVRAAISQEILP